MTLRTALLATLFGLLITRAPHASAQAFDLRNDVPRDMSLSANGGPMGFHHIIEVQSVAKQQGCSIRDNGANDRFSFPGVPCNFSWLVIEGQDARGQSTTIALERGIGDIVGNCERYALLAQANPSNYDLQIAQNSGPFLRSAQTGMLVVWRAAVAPNQQPPRVNLICSLLRKETR